MVSAGGLKKVQAVFIDSVERSTKDNEILALIKPHGWYDKASRGFLSRHISEESGHRDMADLVNPDTCFICRRQCPLINFTDT